MSNEKNECYYSCASLNDLNANKETEIIDINDNSYQNQKHNYTEEQIDQHIFINSIINQEQIEATNEPSISQIDMNAFNKKQSNISSTTEMEKELFCIQENNTIKPKVIQTNSNDSIHIVSFPSVQSFQGNELIRAPQSNIKENYLNHNRANTNNKSNNNTNNKSNSNKNQFSSSKINQKEEETFSNVSSKIIIEELQEKKDYNGTSYRPYQILKYNKHTKDLETKCERRFDNFVAFYAKINRTYPYIILPKLSQKNVLIKIISNDSFYQRRQKQLNFLLNYIYSNKSLSVLPEIGQFINSIEFNEEYYKSPNDDFIGDLHIKNNTMNKLKSSVYYYFNQSRDTDERYNQINKIYSFYDKISKAVEKMKNEIEMTSKLSIETTKNYSNLGSDLSFIREVKTINKEEIQLYEEITEKMSHTSQPLFEALFDKFDNFALLMQGLVEMLERYNAFMNRLKLIRDTYQDYLKNSSNYSCDIPLIKDKAEEKKVIFEKELFISIDSFVEKYGTRFPELIHEFKELIFKANELELGQLKKVNL